VYRLVVGPTQPCIQKIHGSIFAGIKWVLHEINYFLSSSVDFKNAWCFTSILLCPHREACTREQTSFHRSIQVLPDVNEKLNTVIMHNVWKLHDKIAEITLCIKSMFNMFPV
jgi:hypothetical protein